MKLILAILFLCLTASGLRAANPSFIDLVQTNVLWVSKNGNNSTAKPGDPGHRYASISNAVQAAVAPAIVRVAPGVYNESVILRNGINMDMPSGVIVSQAVANLPVMSDDGANVTNSIIGNPIIIQSDPAGNTGSRGINWTGNSSVYINRMTILARGEGMACSGGLTILEYNGKVVANRGGILFNNGQLRFAGEVYGTNDYGVLVSDNNASNYLTGFFFGEKNSAIHIGGGFCMVEDATAVSFDNDFGWGIENSGGGSLIKNCVLLPSKQEAIGKYAGTLMILDSCQLVAGTNCTYSIDNDGNANHGSIEIRNACWANLPPNPAMNILSGSLIVSNTTTWKNPQIFKSVHDLTNIVARTNGNTWFPGGAASFSTTATNQIPVSGWTNNAEINVTVYVTATAVSFTIKNRAGTVMYTSPTITMTLPVILQPGWAINAASGLTGTVLPW